MGNSGRTNHQKARRRGCAAGRDHVVERQVERDPLSYGVQCVDVHGADGGVLVADDGSHRLIGFAEVSRRAYAEGCGTTPVGFLEGWYVEPAHQRQGVGRALVAAAEDWARSKGCREFASDTRYDNADGAAAHRAIGFTEVEQLRCFRKALP